MDNDERELRLLHLAQSGFTVSMCYGSMGDRGIGWTVNVLAPNNESFKKPFACSSMDHCIEVAEREILKRGWTA